MPNKEEIFDKIAYLKQKLKPVEKLLERKFQEQHHKYLTMIYQAKVNCYHKYQQQPHAATKGRDYYQCIQRVEDMVTNNYKKLRVDCSVINEQLNNCIDLCSGKSRTD